VGLSEKSLGRGHSQPPLPQPHPPKLRYIAGMKLARPCSLQRVLQPTPHTAVWCEPTTPLHATLQSATANCTTGTRHQDLSTSPSLAKTAQIAPITTAQRRHSRHPSPSLSRPFHQLLRRHVSRPQPSRPAEGDRRRQGSWPVSDRPGGLAGAAPASQRALPSQAGGEGR
jgi:hypothetical protein